MTVASTADRAARRQPREAGRTRLLALVAVLGPGLLAGLSDDDPAGITTYSVLGAQYGYERGVDRARGHRHSGFGLTSQTGVALVVRATCRAVDHYGGLGYVGGDCPTLRCSGVVEGNRNRALTSWSAVPADACRMVWHRLSSG
jgi:hypothetical protein